MKFSRHFFIYFHNTFGGDSWVLSENYKWLYKNISMLVVFFGKAKTIHIPYWFKKNTKEEYESAKQTCEEWDKIKGSVDFEEEG